MTEFTAFAALAACLTYNCNVDLIDFSDLWEEEDFSPGDLGEPDDYLSSPARFWRSPAALLIVAVFYAIPFALALWVAAGSPRQISIVAFESRLVEDEFRVCHAPEATEPIYGWFSDAGFALQETPILLVPDNLISDVEEIYGFRPAGWYHPASDRVFLSQQTCDALSSDTSWFAVRAQAALTHEFAHQLAFTQPEVFSSVSWPSLDTSYPQNEHTSSQRLEHEIFADCFTRFAAPPEIFSGLSRDPLSRCSDSNFRALSIALS